MVLSSNKAQGDYGEAKFLTRIIGLGYNASIPFGDREKYDLIVDVGGNLNRVQVKTVNDYDKSDLKNRNLSRYKVRCRDSRDKQYTPDDCDMIACLIIPEGIWYIIPMAEGCPLNLVLNPKSARKSKYDKFREAWDLFL